MMRTRSARASARRLYRFDRLVWIAALVLCALLAGSARAASDTQPPTAPGSLSAAASSTSQVNLSWSASVDNVGVYEYRIERCKGADCTNFGQVGAARPSSSGGTYSDWFLSASTDYRYRVRASDAGVNLGAYSNIANVTTQSPADTQVPAAPAGLTAVASSNEEIALAWNVSTDNVGVTGYFVERCEGAGCSDFLLVATPATSTYKDAGRTASTSYSYRVRSRDAANNRSSYSNTASAVTPAIPYCD
jgi:hypothetical protein